MLTKEKPIPEGAVLVTGCSSGIGLETALYLAHCGFRVCATMRDLSRRGNLEAEAARRKVQLELLQLDVTERKSIKKAVERVIERFGGIYSLVNNAGINISGFFEDLSEQEMRRVFETNLFGTMALTQAILPYLREARRGRIVIISSVAGKIAAPGASAYCASKFALEGFGESLAQEMRPFGIQVSLIEPGAVRTELYGLNRRRAAQASNPEGPYYEWFRRLEDLLERLAHSPATSLSEIAEAVRRALTARRPRLRYVAGRRTRILLALRRRLPGELFERIWARETLRLITRPNPSWERSW